MISGQLYKSKKDTPNNVENYSFVIAPMHLAISRSVLRHVATTGKINNTKFSDSPLCTGRAKYTVFCGLIHTDVRLYYNAFP
jgi:hypothetical protein